MPLSALQTVESSGKDAEGYEEVTYSQLVREGGGEREGRREGGKDSSGLETSEPSSCRCISVRPEW